ncbi:hypothetical protein [Candidatus Similichlamydia epinepheli]|uniref:hypothetical protein n=1 Tax=Candidatus Similichlamydia epinepheli TaxID=1903953 RepID=UPI000D35FE07|nr:hypothetical protein [Candidatus Similichlamydia epinepheli]
MNRLLFYFPALLIAFFPHSGFGLPIKQATSLGVLTRHLPGISEEGKAPSDVFVLGTYYCSAELAEDLSSQFDFCIMSGRTTKDAILTVGSGVGFQLIPPKGDEPSCYVNLSAALIEINTVRDPLVDIFPSLAIEVTSRKGVDTLSLECSLSGRFFIPETYQEGTWKRGALFTFEPGCSFWATQELCSFASVKWSFQSSDWVGSRLLSPPRMQTEITLGVRYFNDENQGFSFATGWTVFEPKQAFMTAQTSWKRHF